MATESESREPDLDVGDDTSDFDELAARAGAAVRRPAPEHGVAEVARRGQRHRVVTALTAGGTAIVLIAVGVALLRNDPSPEPTSPVATTQADNGAVSSIVKAALISVDRLGPGWSPEGPRPISLGLWRQAQAAQPECAEFIAAVQPVEATSDGGAQSFINLQSQVVGEMLTIYTNEEAASRVMDSIDAPGFQDCYFATFDAETTRAFPRTGPTTTSFDMAPPAAHGDRQIAFGQETRTAADSRTRLYHIIWVQVGRSIINISVSPDGLGSDNPAGLAEKSITAAISALNAALPAG
jgi:hypothetical protein